MKYIAIIPARGGSKGLPGKNTRMLIDKPLIAWTIEFARKSVYIDRVIVSTDDALIASVSTDYGAEVPFMRPAELSNDTSRTEDVLIHALKWLQRENDYVPHAVVLLQCTSPIRKSGAMEKAIDQFESEHADSLLSVVPFKKFLWLKGPPVQALYDYKDRPMRQDIIADDIRMLENGSIYISKTECLIKHNNRLYGNISMFEMSADEGYEIDNETDFLVVESIMKNIVDYRNK